jgi:hypothetical protein
MEKMSKNGVKAKNQLIDFIGLSKRHFCQKWLKIQIGEGIVIYTASQRNPHTLSRT